MNTLTYTVIFEKAGDGGWGAHVPDLPVVAAGAPTREETERLIKEAI